MNKLSNFASPMLEWIGSLTVFWLFQVLWDTFTSKGTVCVAMNCKDKGISHWILYLSTILNFPVVLGDYSNTQCSHNFEFCSEV